LKVEEEIYAQVEAFRLFANGKLPEHADGHQHVHILPGIIFSLNLMKSG